MNHILALMCSYLVWTTNIQGFIIPTRSNNVLRSNIVHNGKTSLSMVADNAKVILVTGSSRGLGKSIALDLGSHGQKVVVNYVSESSKAGADATVEEIKSLGGDAIAVQADSTYRCYSTFFLKKCVYDIIRLLCPSWPGQRRAHNFARPLSTCS